MNQSYSRERKFSIILITLFLFLYSLTSISQVKDELDIISKKADAYYLFNYTDVTYRKNWGSYKKYTSVTNKLVVNNVNGVEKYAFLNLSEYESNHLTEIDVKTLKTDGTFVTLDSNLVFKKTDRKKKFSEINYPIPAVEPGDTISISYVYYEYLKKSDLTSYASLHKNLPSKNSQFTIRTDGDLTVRYKVYNGFPKPKIITNDTLIYLEFSIDKLKGFKENEYSCFTCELPYLYYSLEKEEDQLRTWNDVYNEEFNSLTQPLKIDYNNITYYKRWKKRTIGEAKDSSKYYKFKLLYNEVINNFKITQFNPNEFIKSNGYFLKEKKFDPISIRRFYRQILEDLEINYWAVFAKSKRSGSIDENYIRKREFDHIFFAYEKQNGAIDFLYPHSEIFKYQINEIPTSIYNTGAVLVKPVISSVKRKKNNKFITRNLKLAKVDSVSIAKIVLPGMNFSFNTVNQVVYSKVNLLNKTVNHKSRLRISGGLSTEIRNFFNTLNNDKQASQYYDALSKFEGDKNAIQIDSIVSRKFNTKKPFAYTINSTGKVNNVLNFINDSLVSFSLKQLINHSIIETIPINSDLSYFLDYTYSDNFTFNMEFPKNIEIIGIKNANIKLKNQYGDYIFQIKKSQENKIKIYSSYKIKKTKIPKESYYDLKSLNNEIEKVKSRKFIIKIKQ